VAFVDHVTVRNELVAGAEHSGRALGKRSENAHDFEVV
jgi:hypothetical protein